MNSSLKPGGIGRLFFIPQEISGTLFCTRNSIRLQNLAFVLLVLVWPLAASGQSASPQQSSSQQPPAQTQAPPPGQAANIDPPAQKPVSLAEAARKAKENKPPVAKGKVYTEDDLAGMKGPGVSVVGDAPRKTPKRGQSAGPDGGYGGGNDEQYWRERAREILDAIAQTDEQIAQKKEEIKKLGNGGFDVTTGFNQNIAYINDRNAQLKQLEQHKVDLQKQLDDLADEGRKVGAPASWFR